MLRLILYVSALASLSVGVACTKQDVGGRDAHARNLILITVDTLRADHTFTQRGGVALTPALEKFAGHSLRYVEAASVGTETASGLAGILTGLLPSRSGVFSNTNRLAANLKSLPRRLQEEGFITAAWVANPVVKAGGGFEGGFDSYEFVKKEKGASKARADVVSRQAWHWIESLRARDSSREQRFFVWLHYMDPHGPYLPSPASRQLFSRSAFGEAHDVPLQQKGKDSGRGAIPYYQWRALAKGSTQAPTDARDYLERYAAEIVQLDRELGWLLEKVRASGLLEDSIVIISSDHGEALDGDHGFYFSHSNGLTQDQLHVPLLLYYPGCEAGVDVTVPVSTVDILPTALSLLGLANPPEIDGHDLPSRASDSSSQGRAPAVVSETVAEIAIRSGPWKLRQARGGDRGQLTRLDLDANEAENLLNSAPRRTRAFRKQLRSIQRRPRLAPSLPRIRLSDKRRKELEALGYLD